MQVTDTVLWTGVLDPDLRVFDVVIPTEYGTTYNSYLIKAKKPTLIDTVKGNFTEEFLEKLTAAIDLADLQYLVVNHTEPDHSGAVSELLQRAPHLKVYGSPAALRFLRAQVGRDFDSVAVKHNDTLDLGARKWRFCVVR
ncbi:MAG: MBL fold metallo-hydrolase [Firmicutes bacterium]|nr:MBL fold metallo-hydrolase [Bacillota bacterium]